ncbi:MAG: beta-ketoacyl synthase N-terminal-like domain-containing protein [Gammaproteobacteria bacterium]
MIPSVFIHLEILPLTANGKVDLKKLPETKLQNADKYIAPRNNLEEKLCGLWSELLNIELEQIGVDDSFFDLGGNSLLVIRLKTKIEKDFGISNIDLTDLFKYATISEFGKYLATKANDVSEKPRAKNEYDFIDRYDEGVAVIAMEGMFPHAKNVDEYWQNIISGKECFDRLTIDECRSRGVPEEFLTHDNFVPVGGCVDGIDKFDPAFWNFSFNDALMMDPQIRKFLECSWHALEKSGYINNRKDNKIGVFAGMSISKYCESRIQNNVSLNSKSFGFGMEHLNEKDYLATRVSYLLGLTGPSLNINTACSTSLVAIVEACKNISFGFCDMAIAGGVSLPMPEHHGYVYQEGMIFSKDGHCKVFDIESSGTVGSAGVGVVVLKKLKDAIRDNDNIVAVVKGYATNNDGDKKVGYTAPSVIGQTACILEAQKHAKISADKIGYVECHGTGTPMGDPIEIAALHDAFSSNSENGNYDCKLGAVKANIGHAASAAGVAGFIKTCCILKNKKIPPQVSFNSPNPNLNLNRTNFSIPKDEYAWKQRDPSYKRRAGVSSFGFGGTNAHVILEEYISSTENEKKHKNDNLYILPISAASAKSCRQYGDALLNCLKSSLIEGGVSDVACALSFKRKAFAYRNFVVCKNKLEAIENIKNMGSSIRANKFENDIIMMFSGQGTQYLGMARELYDTQEVFKLHVDDCCKIISEIEDIDFTQIFFVGQNNAKISINIDVNQTKWSQPALFVVSYSLAKLFQYYGVQSQAYIGHSIGEYVAAALSEVFSLKDALYIVMKRASLMQNMPCGEMLSINASVAEVKEILSDGVVISLCNAPKYTVVSGDANKISSFGKVLDSKGINYRKIHTSHPFHSEYMRPAAEELKNILYNIVLNNPSERFVSNLTGKFIDTSQAIDPEYWAEHMCKTVEFSKGINTLITEFKHPLFLEVGPGNVLSTFVAQHYISSKANNLPIISSIPSAKEYKEGKLDNQVGFYKAIGKLWQFGYKLDWSLLLNCHSESFRVIDLPAYQFEGNDCWIPLPEIVNNNAKIVKKTYKDHKKQKINILIEKATELEGDIAEIFSEVLGCKGISKNDSFFELGGNSLSSVNFTKILNDKLNVDVSLSAIFQYDTVAKLARYILSLDVKSSYKKIIKLNDAKNKNGLFMIHPGLGGCEVYVPLAQALSKSFACYGIDSYNLYHDKKIDNLNELANYYLKHIKEIYVKNNYQTYNFLGWSLGGVVALEMASILERKGIFGVNVYLLDTFIDDKYLSSIKDRTYIEKLEKDYEGYLRLEGYNESYIDKMLPNVNLAMQFEKQGVTSCLENTNVWLYKAVELDSFLNSDELKQVYNYSIKLKSNNIDRVVKHKDKLKIFNVNNAHHNNILEKIEFLAENIRDTKD